MYVYTYIYIYVYVCVYIHIQQYKYTCIYPYIEMYLFLGFPREFSSFRHFLSQQLLLFLFPTLLLFHLSLQPLSLVLFHLFTRPFFLELFLLQRVGFFFNHSLFGFLLLLTPFLDRLAQLLNFFFLCLQEIVLGALNERL